jgi:hypothetical protein
LTLERQLLQRTRSPLHVFRLRLPRRRGAIIHMACTSVPTIAATLASSRRCDCGGVFQPVDSYLRLLLQSHHWWCSRCDYEGILECVFLHVSVDGLAPLLGCRPIRVRVPWVSIYMQPSPMQYISSSPLSYCTKNTDLQLSTTNSIRVMENNRNSELLDPN